MSLRQCSRKSTQILLVCLAVVSCYGAAIGQAQSNAADLQGSVRDPKGAVVAGATVTARNTATNSAREATTNDDGFYKITNLSPGEYEVTVKAQNYKTALLPSVKLTVGQTANQDIPLEVGDLTATVTVTSASPNIVETTATSVSSTVDQQRIENLPINERNYLSFALTTSTVGRDNGRPIGPAPTTGLNFGGQRGRSNLVQVDGADNTDNSVNASRSTVSQEAVQEFQVVTNSFAPEFGRSSGGVVNVVTKGGTNKLQGNVFGFLRHKSFQARNPFAPVDKPPFTRAQYGGTLGGLCAAPAPRIRLLYQRCNAGSGRQCYHRRALLTFHADVPQYHPGPEYLCEYFAEHGSSADRLGRAGKYCARLGVGQCGNSVRLSSIKRGQHCADGH